MFAPYDFIRMKEMVHQMEFHSLKGTVQELAFHTKMNNFEFECTNTIKKNCNHVLKG